MPQEKKIFAKYYIFRRNQALWNGNAAEDGARFRQVCMTSDEWFSPFGAFQVYCLQAAGQGLERGILRVGPPELLFDGDFNGQAEADKKFEELVRQAEKEGFRVPNMMEVLEFQAKVQEQKKANH